MVSERGRREMQGRRQDAHRIRRECLAQFRECPEELTLTDCRPHPLRSAIMLHPVFCRRAETDSTGELRRA
jgi:hypothetical protein